MPPKKKATLIGNGMNANLLKEFIDFSYKGNTSVAPAGYSIDAPLSDSRVKVYTKNGSNDKDVVVTHRGSVGLDDWMDNASYLFRGKVKGTKTYNLHRERHKKAVDKYGAKNIIAIGHSRAGLYLQELQKEFPIKENITYNKASGFFDIGRQNDANQTDIRVGNDVVSLLAPLQKRPNTIVKIDGTKNPFDFNTAHQSSEIDKLGTTFIGKKEEVVGEGIQPRISGVNQIRKLLGVEQRRLQRIQNGITKYKSKYITEPKIVERISRLKKRLASAEANDGQATEEFFVPKTEKWLKIHKNETYLNTPLKDDGKHKRMVSEIDKRIEELKSKKAKKTKKATTQDVPQTIVEEIKKVEEAVKAKEEEPKPKVKLTREERKKIAKAKKAEYDRLRYLQLKAKKLGQQTETQTQPKQVEKIKEEVKIFKEEVKEFVEDLEKDDSDTSEFEDEDEEEDDDDEDDDDYKTTDDDRIEYLKKYAKLIYSDDKLSKDEIASLKKVVDYKQLKEGTDMIEGEHEKLIWLRQTAFEVVESTFDEPEDYEEEIDQIQSDVRDAKRIHGQSSAKQEYLKKYKGTHNLQTDIPAEQLDLIKRFAKLKLIVMRLEEKKPQSGQTDIQYRQQQMRALRQIALSLASGNPSYSKVPASELKLYENPSYDEDGTQYVSKKATSYNFGVYDVYDTKKGKGFNKKQLRQIILDKNKVIADLEETAYGGNYNSNYLDTILDSNSTSQNIIIHREIFNSIPKYIQPL